MAAPRFKDKLNKTDLLEQYKAKCKSASLTPHRAFVRYLEETYDDSLTIEIVI